MRISDWSSDVCSSDLQTAQRRLLAQFLKVRLFRFRYADRSTEQRVAQAVTLTRPCYPIIDDVGIYGAIFPNLTNLYPPILGYNTHDASHCATAAFTQCCQGLSIGRASVRERVVKSALFSVVGVPLKTKKR